MVNAKNSYGGYVGFVPFIATVKVNNGKATGRVIMAMGGPGADDNFVAEKTCRDFGLDPYLAK